MKLAELSARAQVPVSTIKYLLRLGVLPPGRKRNATTAEYGEGHLERLQLVTALRQVVGASIEQVQALVELVDDPDVPLLRVMEAAQVLGGGLGEQPTAPPAVAGRVAELVTTMGWPDVDTDARAAVTARLARMAELGVDVGPQYLRAVAVAVDGIGLTGLDPAGSRDRVAMQVAVGSHEHARLVVAMLQLAQASHSIRAHRELPATRP